MKAVNVTRVTFAVFAAALVAPNARAADGKAIAENGTATVPACSSCHGGKGEGMPENGYPRLAGLNSEEVGSRGEVDAHQP
jgi:cytochrome c553